MSQQPCKALQLLLPNLIQKNRSRSTDTHAQLIRLHNILTTAKFWQHGQARTTAAVDLLVRAESCYSCSASDHRTKPGTYSCSNHSGDAVVEDVQPAVRKQLRTMSHNCCSNLSEATNKAGALQAIAIAANKHAACSPVGIALVSWLLDDV
jgi:hypothetical protein